MTATQLALEILRQLHTFGVREFIVCAGARNAAFVDLLSKNESTRKNESSFLSDFKTHFFYDERAAGFFALGRARRESKPVAVVTTSGTAAAELLPASIESFYSAVPLVFITADRPKHYRGKAAPQSIEQVHLFGKYAPAEYDFDKNDTIQMNPLAPRGVTHINVCLTDPNENKNETHSLTNEIKSDSQAEDKVSQDIKSTTDTSRDVADFFHKAKRPIVILGALPRTKRGAVLEILKQLNLPVYAEAHSGLREAEALQNNLLKINEYVLSADFFVKHFDSVIRIGSVPTLRLWRDLEDKLSHTPVLSVSDLGFSGLGREQNKSIQLNDFFAFIEKHKITFLAGDVFENLKKTAITVERKIQHNLDLAPLSEPAFFRFLSQNIPPSSMVFLGNSLPIREWDLAATFSERHYQVISNRGANGIDGLISTFLGQCYPDRENWLILGDLSALYDLNALSFAKESVHKNIRIVVINNGGGHIFKRMFQNQNFINEHDLNFASWAKMFHFQYKNLSEPSWPELLHEPTVLEICPDNQQTELFWQSYGRSPL